MQIVVRRSVPWFPLVLAAAWVLMLGLAVRDLAWFAGASFESHSRPAAVSRMLPSSAAARKKVVPCSDAAIAPAAQVLRP